MRRRRVLSLDACSARPCVGSASAGGQTNRLIDECAARTDRLVVEAAECVVHLTDPEECTACVCRCGSFIESCEQNAENLPCRARERRRLNRSPESLHATVEARERSFFFCECRDRQNEVSVARCRCCNVS